MFASFVREMSVSSSKLEKLEAEAATSDDLQTVQQIAKKKKKKIRIRKAFEPCGRIRCGDCGGSLPEGTWYVEEILYYDEPMIKYWFPWDNDLRPAAYSWPVEDKEFLCTKCFDNRDDSRTKMTANRAEALQAAAKSAIKLHEGGPFFPGRERRRCSRCHIILTNRGWYSSGDITKNNIPVNVCWDVQKGELMPLAYKVRGPAETYICFKCFKECDEKIDVASLEAKELDRRGSAPFYLGE
jgi:hypothetical protein